MNWAPISVKDGSRHASIMDWLDEPRTETGLRFASGTDEWHFLPYSDLVGRVRRAAQRFRNAGVAPGEAVVLICPTSPDFVAAWFGALACGATPSPLAIPMAFGDAAAYAANVRRATRLIAARAVITTTDLMPTLTALDLGIPLIDSADSPGPEMSVAEPPPETGLFQFSSGSTGPQRALRVPFTALNANIHTQYEWLGYKGHDALATWLPLHHDMGLISSLLGPFMSQTDIWLMTPEQFVRSPLRWLRCHAAGRATTSVCPPFGLAHVVRRVRAKDLAGLDFSGWTSLVTGAERIDPAVVRSFVDLLAPFGFSANAVLPAYGLAEATLAVTGAGHDRPVQSVRVDVDSLRTGFPVRFTEAADESIEITDCGSALTSMAVSVVDDNGHSVPAGVLGEIEISGHSLASGYRGDDGETHFGSTIRSGDAGFLLDGRLFVVGRIGDSVKLRGRWLFAEELDDVAAKTSPRPRKTVVLMGDTPQGASVVVVVEGGAGDSTHALGAAVAERAAGARVQVIAAPPGWIAVTTSGKVRRREMWRRLREHDTKVAITWDSQRDGDCSG